MSDGFSSLHKVDLFLNFEISLFQKVWSGKFDNPNLMGFSYICRKKGDNVQIYIHIFLLLWEIFRI